MSNSLYVAPDFTTGSRWDISVRGMVELLAGWPDTRTSVYDVSGRPALQFRFPLDTPSGEGIGGFSADPESLTAESPFDPEAWAPFLSWFLAQLPPGTGTIVFTEVDPVPVSLPERATPDQIVAAYAAVEAGG